MNLVFNKSFQFSENIAVKDANGQYTYAELSALSDGFKSGLKKFEVKKGERVAFLCSPGIDYVKTLWGIWKSGAVAVPLCPSHPEEELNDVLKDTGTSLLIYNAVFKEKIVGLSGSCIKWEINSEQISCGYKERLNNEENENDSALILYTSGSTGKPKGVVHTHRSLHATITALVNSWGWSGQDHVLHVLPLHHTHGIVNILLCAMYVGATCEFLPKFDSKMVWKKFLEGDVNLFMAVPTIYSKLITHWNEAHEPEQKRMSLAAQKFRLMVSGSAALPVSVLDKWEFISGHRLLERYGMTEIGMAISNPLKGERKSGSIGQALPGVMARLVDESGALIQQENEPGEIQVKGESLFKEYWGNAEETKKAFTQDGWFKTGDIAQLENGYYRILGRNSVDIIKSGGYKISALEIEEVLRKYDGVSECAVVGIPDEEWGQIITAVIVEKNIIDPEHLKVWCREWLSPYKIPRNVRIVHELPKNVLGKVMKSEMLKW